MVDKQYTRAEIVDMELYEFFALIAKASISQVLVIKQSLEKSKIETLRIAEQYKKKMFEFTPDSFDGTKFDEYFTHTIRCFALAMYIDKKITLCKRREEDLTPKVFKKGS